MFTVCFATPAKTLNTGSSPLSHSKKIIYNQIRSVFYVRKLKLTRRRNLFTSACSKGVLTSSITKETNEKNNEVKVIAKSMDDSKDILFQKEIWLRLSSNEGVYCLTQNILVEIPELQQVQTGVANLFLQSTDASLTMNVHESSAIQKDLNRAMDKIVNKTTSKDSAKWVKSALMGVSVNVPIHAGCLHLGALQGVHLCDWTGNSNSTNGRKLIVTVQGTEASGCRAVHSFKAPKRGVLLSTHTFSKAVPALAECKTGVLNLSLEHTTAALTINENADKSVQTDMDAALNHIVPATWAHSLFTPRKSGSLEKTPGHMKALLVGTSLNIPINRGAFAFGTWQGIHVCENLSPPPDRKVVATLLNQRVQSQTSVSVTAKRGCLPITQLIQDAAPTIATCKVGTVNLFVQHTSASLACADKAASEALTSSLNAIVPEKWNNEFFIHTHEGPDDMPGHVKTTLTGVSLTIPISEGKLALGKDQELFLCEHRDEGGWGGRHRRVILITVLGE